MDGVTPCVHWIDAKPNNSQTPCVCICVLCQAPAEHIKLIGMRPMRAFQWISVLTPLHRSDSVACPLQAELATVLSLAATVAGIMVAAGLLIKRDTERSREQIGKWAAQGHSAGYSGGVGDLLAEGLLSGDAEGALADGDMGAGALPAALAGPVVLSWSRVGFSVPAPGGGPGRRRILRGVSGVAGAVPAEGDEPGGGCLTAIIGPSGQLLNCSHFLWTSVLRLLTAVTS